MANFAFEIAAEPRHHHGKGASRRLRRQDNVPAIIYGAQHPPQSISIPHRVVLKSLEDEGFFSRILDLSLEGKAQKVVLKAVQRHPFKPRILHLDFMRINENDPITMHIPLRFLEENAPGIKAGGTITHHIVEIEIKCLPRDLPQHIEVDLTQAELDTVVHLSDLKLPKGCELLTAIHGPEDDAPVASLHKKREETTDAPASKEASAPESEK